MSTESVITKIHILQTQSLSKEAFAPFGVVLTPEGRERLPINTYGDKLDLYREPFESDQPTEWFIVQGRVREMKALFLERHHHITQAFIPLNGDGFVMVVAEANAPEENGLVSLEHLRAFVIPGDTAIQLYRSTWHENPFPLKDNQCFLVTSHQALSRAHQQNPDASLAQLPLDLERKWFKDSGLELQIQ
jgi:ureidoglycolate lyase